MKAKSEVGSAEIDQRNDAALNDEVIARRPEVAVLMRLHATPPDHGHRLAKGQPDDAGLVRAIAELDALSRRIATHTGDDLAHLLDVIAKEPESLIVIKWRSEPARGANGLRMVFEPSARFGELLAALRIRANELDGGVVDVLDIERP
jgi:hypothetical protein